MKSFRIKQIFERNKIILSFAPLVLLPVVALLVITITIYSAQAVERSKKVLQNNAFLVSEQINHIFIDAQNCSNIINLDINHSFSLLKYESNEKIRELKLRNSIKTTLDLYKSMFNNLNEIYYISLNGNIISTENNIRKKLDIEKFLVEANASEYGGKYFRKWLNMSKYNIVSGDSNVYHICLVRPVININNLENMGYIVISVNEENISSVYEQLNENFIILDSNNLVVSSVNKKDILSNTRDLPDLDKDNVSIIKLSDKRYVHSNICLKNLNWHLISELDLNSATYESTEIIKNIVYIMVFIIFLCIIIGKHLSDKQVREVEKRKRKYDLDIMQAQIKPHFLYNALDLVYVLCAMGNVKEAKDSTKALADFYRLSLSGGDNIISLKDELLNVENYLKIQNKRYSDKFDFNIEVDIEINNYKIPKLTLQPLVENSIYHGLKPRENKGNLFISGRNFGNYAVVSIEDSGVGIKKEIIDLLLLDDSNSSKSAFGLKNIVKRLELYYGTKILDFLDTTSLTDIVIKYNSLFKRNIDKQDIYVISNYMVICTKANLFTTVILFIPKL